MNGTAYIIWIDTVTPVTASQGASYRPVACGISNGFNMSVESIAFRNKCDDGWENSESGYGSWGMDLDGHAIALQVGDDRVNFNEIGQLLVDKRKFWIRMADLDGTVVREGVARVGSFTETADLETPYSFDASFVGIGKPILDAIPLPPPPGSVTVYYGSYEDIEDVDLALIQSWDFVVIEPGQPYIIPFNEPDFLFTGFALIAGLDPFNHWQEVATPSNQGEIGSEDDLFQSPVEIEGLDFYAGGYPVSLVGEYLIDIV